MMRLNYSKIRTAVLAFLLIFIGGVMGFKAFYD